MLLKDYFEGMSDSELKEETQELHSTVNVVECFGVKDVILLAGAIRELESRGFEAKVQRTLVIEKVGEKG